MVLYRVFSPSAFLSQQTCFLSARLCDKNCQHTTKEHRETEVGGGAQVILYSGSLQTWHQSHQLSKAHLYKPRGAHLHWTSEHVNTLGNISLPQFDVTETRLLNPRLKLEVLSNVKNQFCSVRNRTHPQQAFQKPKTQGLKSSLTLI